MTQRRPHNETEELWMVLTSKQELLKCGWNIFSLEFIVNQPQRKTLIFIEDINGGNVKTVCRFFARDSVPLPYCHYDK